MIYCFWKIVLYRLITSLSITEESSLNTADIADLPKNLVNQQHLKQAWDTANVATRDDWLEWYRRVSVEFLKESPSHALRACAPLLDPGMSASKELAKDLFNVSFLSCWTDLYENYQVLYENRPYPCVR